MRRDLFPSTEGEDSLRAEGVADLVEDLIFFFSVRCAKREAERESKRETLHKQDKKTHSNIC